MVHGYVGRKTCWRRGWKANGATGYRRAGSPAIAPEARHNQRRPEGLVKIGFSVLKQKLLGSIAAIAAVNVLEWFMDIDRHADNTKLAWVVGILLAFAAAMLVLAIADRVSTTRETGC